MKHLYFVLRLTGNRNFSLYASVGLAFFLYLSCLLVADEPKSYDSIVENFKQYKATHKHAVTDEYLNGMLANSGLDIQTIGQLIDYAGEQQRPQINKKQLLKIIGVKRALLHDMMCKYSVDSKIIDAKSKSIAGLQTLEYVAKDRKHLLIENDNRALLRIGEDTIIVNERNGKNASVGVTNNFHPSMFFQPFSPVSMAMLLDTKIYNQSDKACDLVYFLEQSNSFVFEKTERVDDADCIVVASLGMRVLLDPKRDFSVIFVERYDPEYVSAGTSSVRYVGRHLASRRHLKEMQDYGNGIWLPQRTEFVYYSKLGKIDEQRQITLISASISTSISDAIFDNVIPDDAIVYDKKRGMTYKKSNESSINGLLKDTATSKRVMIFRHISMTAGLVMIVIALVMKYRNYRNKKDS